MNTEPTFYQKVTVRLLLPRHGKKTCGEIKQTYPDACVLDGHNYLLICEKPEALVKSCFMKMKDFKKMQESKDIKGCIEYIKNILVQYAENQNNPSIDVKTKSFLDNNAVLMYGDIRYNARNTQRIQALYKVCK